MLRYYATTTPFISLLYPPDPPIISGAMKSTCSFHCLISLYTSAISKVDASDTHNSNDAVYLSIHDNLPGIRSRIEAALFCFVHSKL